MKRRNFLQLSAFTGLAMGVPAGLRHARAASAGSRGLFVLVQATGGWDPRFVCDPTLDPAQNRAYRGIGHQGQIAYAPLVMTPRSTGLSADSAEELMSAPDFFEAHGERLLCINGIETGTLDHDQGTRALWSDEREGSGATARVLELADGSTSPRFTDPELADLDRFMRHATMGLTAYQAGLTDALHLELGGFDSHGSNDRAQTRQLGKLYRGVDALLCDAASRGLEDRVTVLITSEMGRSAGYDGPGNFAGKDHGSVTSAMLLGPGIEGGHTIGGTTADLQPAARLGAGFTPAAVLAMASA